MEQVLDSVMELSVERRGILAKILHKRHIAEQRKAIASNAQISLDLFRAGKLRQQRADDLIVELRSSLEKDADLEDDVL